MKMGRILAKSIIDVLVNGKSVSEVPVKMDEEPKLYLNMETAKKLEIEIPLNILRFATVIQETEGK